MLERLVIREVFLRMARAKRRGKTQPLYIITGRAIARGWGHFTGAAAVFWRDLIQARGNRYFRALAVFCVLCMLAGAGASLAWRSAAIQAAVSHYRAVFLGTGGQTVDESPPPALTGQATPAGARESPPGGSGVAATPATGAP